MSEAERNEVFERNLALLARRWPDAARQVVEVGRSPHVHIEPSRQGEPTLRVHGENGEDVWVHSRYRPREEARRQIEKLSVGANDSLVIVGGGLGYAAVEAAERLPRTTFVVLVEPDVALLRQALETVSFEPFLRRGEADLIICGCQDAGGELVVDEDRLFRRLDESVSRLLGGGLKLLSQPVLKRAYPRRYETLLKTVHDFTLHGAVAVRSALYLSRISIDNQFANLPDYLLSPGLSSLAGKFRGHPAVLVAAGPSLEKNVELVRQAQGKAVIIAVSTAMKVLLGRGIRPDLTAIIDYHNVSARYFESVPEDQAAPVVCDMKANHGAIDAYRGARLFGNDTLMNTLLDGAPGDKGTLLASATVAHAGFDVARTLGCDPIILVGLDLSYPQGRHHVAGTAQQQQYFGESSRFNTFEMKEVEWYFLHRKRLMSVPAIGGGETWTSDIFFSYLREFEKLFEDSPQRIIDATEGGARKRGTEVMALEAALGEFATRPLPASPLEIVREAQEQVDVEALRASALESLDERLKDIRALSGAYRKAIRLLRRIVKVTRGGKPADDLVVQTIELKKRFERYGFLYYLLNHFAQADLFVRAQKDRSIHGDALRGVDRQRHQAERDLEYIEGLQHALGEVEKKVRAVRRKLVELEPAAVAR